MVKKELVLFIISGLLSATIFFIFFSLQIEVLKLNTTFSYSVSFLVSSLFTFIFNRNITFYSVKNKYKIIYPNFFFLKQLFKYLLMLIFSYLFGLFLIEILTIRLNISIYISSLINIFLSGGIRFLILKKVVFK